MKQTRHSYFLCSIIIGCLVQAEPKTIYLIPDNDECLDDKLFEHHVSWKNIKENLSAHHGYIVKTPKKKEKDKNYPFLYNFEDQNDIKYIIDLTPNSIFAFRYAEKFPHKIIIFLWEPPVVTPHLYEPHFHENLAKIFTWNDDLVDGKKYFKIYYPVLFKWTFDIVALRSFFEKKLCTLINSNKSSDHPHELYSARKSMIEFFENIKLDEFDLYGHGWQTENYKNYQGIIDCQRSYLRLYRFAICYENMRDVKGYVTEKIFNCLTSGCVPIYWGASNITDYIPESCFIDRRIFSSNEELYSFMKNMTSLEYQNYLENMLAFLTSDLALKFTPDHLRACVQEGLLAE